MTFAWPLAWWGMGAAVPIIALYLVRTRLQRRPASTLLFWQQLAPQIYNQSLWRKLRRWISLLLQLLFLALLVFALAQPLARWQSAAPASRILVLDASPTMLATDVAPSRWDHALKLAADRIGAMRFFDETTLILAGETPRVLSAWTRSKRSLRDALRDLAPAPSAHIEPALTLARQLASQREGATIELISDGVWKSAPSADALQGVQPRWIGGSAVNAGLTRFTVRRSLAAPGEYQLLARAVSNTRANANVELWQDGRLTDVQPVVFEPGRPWEKTWSGEESGAASFEAKLTGLTRDDLAIDNTASARLEPLQNIPIALAGPPQPFLEAALSSMDLVDVKTVATVPERAEPGVLYVFHRSAPPPEFGARAVLLIDPPGDGFWGKSLGELESPLVSEIDRDALLLKFVALENVRVQKAGEFAPSAGSAVFAESFGKPLLFGHWKGERRWLVVPFRLEDADFVFRTAFPILLGNLVQSLRTEAFQNESRLPGAAASELRRTAPADPAQTASATAQPFWAGWPLWWCALALGVAWLLAEWWTFSRRVTE